MGTDRAKLRFNEALEGDEESGDLQDPGELWVVSCIQWLKNHHSFTWFCNYQSQWFDLWTKCAKLLATAAFLKYIFFKAVIRAWRLPPTRIFICFKYYLLPHFSDYRYRKDEIFKRLKVTTFAQLVSTDVYYLIIPQHPAKFMWSSQLFLWLIL